MKCRVKGCKGVEHARGLCKRHYDQAWKLKLREPEKYDALVKQGVILPAYARGKELAALAEQIGQ